MKNLIVAFFLLLAGILTAQGNPHQTLLGRSPLSGAFGGPIYEFPAGSETLGGIGGGGGLVFRYFFLGAYGVASTDALQELLDDGDLSGIGLSHGGLWLGATPLSYKAIHPYVSVRGGWGVLDIDFNDPDQQFSDLDQVFVVTPEVGLELNVTRWFRVAGTVAYRYVTGVNEATPPVVGDNIQGLTGGITLRFGWFGSGRHRHRDDW